MEKNLIFLTILLISFSVEGLCAVRTAVFNPWTGKYDYVGGGVGDIVASGTSGSVLYIDSNGNLAQDNTNLFWDATNHRLGLGTTSPGNLLTVNGRGGFNNDQITIGGTSGLAAERGYINYDGTTARLRITSVANVGLGFGTNAGVDKVIIDTSGKVGIGALTPIAQLEVRDSTANGQAAAVYQTATSGTVFALVVQANGSATTAIGGQFDAIGGTNNRAIQTTTDTAAGANNYSIYSNSPAQSYFNGNVGIGTSPSYPFEVRSSTTAAPKTIVSAFENSTVNRNTLAIRLGTGVADLLSSYSSAAENVDLSFTPTKSDGTQTEAMRIQASSGNVGIGTVSPTNILSFGGNTTRTLWMERHTTANTAGNSLSVQAGGATAGATDKNGGALILSPGVSTGTGIVSVNIKGYTQATTGTSDNTQIDRQIVGNVKTLANNTNTAMVNCTIANGTVIAGVLRYAIEVTDGTDYQVEEGMISYHVTNKAGVLANNTVVKFGNQQAMTAGTLTVTFTITAANPAVLTLNANSSLTPSAGYPKVTYTIDNLTSQALAIV